MKNRLHVELVKLESGKYIIAKAGTSDNVYYGIEFSKRADAMTIIYCNVKVEKTWRFDDVLQ